MYVFYGLIQELPTEAVYQTIDAGIIPTRPSNVASMPSNFWTPLVEDVAKNPKWYQRFPDPVQRPTLGTPNQRPPFYTPLVEDVSSRPKWFAPLSTPVPRPTLGAQNQRPPFYTPLVEDVSSRPKWFAPLSLPVPRPTLGTPNQRPPFYTPLVEDVSTKVKWYAPLSVPVPLPRSDIRQQSLAFTSIVTTETITADKWFMPLSTPVRPPVQIRQQYLVTTPFLEDAALAAKWYQPLSLPVPRPRLAAASQMALARTQLVDDPAVSAKWFMPLSQPTRLVPIGVGNQSGFFRTQLVDDAATNAAKWFMPLSEPVAVQVILFQANFDGLGAEEITIDKWYQPLSIQARRRDFAVPLQRSIIYAPQTIASSETITVDKWYMPLSQPVSRKPIGAGNQRGWAGAPFLEDASLSAKWFVPLSTPVPRPTLGASLQQSIVLPGRSISEPWGWYVRLEQPVRLRESMARQQALAFTAVVTAAETITVDKWFMPLSAPVQSKPFNVSLQQSVAFVRGITPFAWTIAVDRIPPGRNYPAGQQQSIMFTPTPAETITADKWYQPLSTPPRYRSFPAGLQQSIAFVRRFDAENLVMGWYQPISLPVPRPPARQPAALTYVATFGTTEPDAGRHPTRIRVLDGAVRFNISESRRHGDSPHKRSNN